MSAPNLFRGEWSRRGQRKLGVEGQAWLTGSPGWPLDFIFQKHMRKGLPGALTFDLCETGEENG